MTMFSVIIATRNRPSLFRDALASVSAQTCKSMEIIVVDDGSDEERLPRYQEVISAVSRPVRFYSLERRLNGHGQSYAINYGAAQTKAEYLCFLDDDDLWTDAEYLARTDRVISDSTVQPDLLFSNQAAFLLDQRQPGPIWIEDLAEILPRSGRSADKSGVYRVTVKELLRGHGFCHLNTTIVRRDLFDSIGGMDEEIRWECDHDLYLRLLDRAPTMLYSPLVVARHNIPDPVKKASMTTALSEFERRVIQLRVFDNVVTLATHPAIRAYGRRHKGYTLKRIAELLVAHKEYSSGLYYARQALGAGPTFKWAVYTMLVALARLKQMLWR